MVISEREMLNSHDFMKSKLAKHREVELLKKATISKLLAGNRAVKPGYRVRFLSRIGEILILFGQKLKGRHEADMHSPGLQDSV